MRKTAIAEISAKHCSNNLNQESGSLMRHVGMSLLIVLTTFAMPVEIWSQPSKNLAAGPEVISVRLSNFSYDPDHLRLRAGVPIRLQLVNESNGGHNFTAAAFFAASSFAAGSLLPLGGKVEVAGRTTTELTLIPHEPGVYPMQCTHFLHSLFGMTGTIEVTGPAG